MAEGLVALAAPRAFAWAPVGVSGGGSQSRGCLDAAEEAAAVHTTAKSAGASWRRPLTGAAKAAAKVANPLGASLVGPLPRARAKELPDRPTPAGGSGLSGVKHAALGPPARGSGVAASSSDASSAPDSSSCVAAMSSPACSSSSASGRSGDPGVSGAISASGLAGASRNVLDPAAAPARPQVDGAAASPQTSSASTSASASASASTSAWLAWVAWPASSASARRPTSSRSGGAATANGPHRRIW
mmetsp:Transcript_24465/g.70214  ORF Transcript_24465/g.70214 Transcript_24465/m.70214 type:complete len:245 (-) Transcript_24465:256-990(-)